MKNTFLLLLISLVLLGCKKDEIGNAHIEGYVTNRVTGDPIQNIEVTLYDSDWTSYKIVSTQTPDSTGYFLFDGNYQSYSNHLTLSLGEYYDDYQSAVFLNGRLDSLFFAFGLKPQRDSSDPQIFNFELYPITFFAIVLNNIHPAASNDKINLTIQNINNGDGLVYDGIEHYEYNGPIQNKIISGETKIGNIISINYDVTSDGVITSYQKIFECTPGKETTFELNY